MNTTYDPKLFERKIYERWLNAKCFHADEKSDKKPFTIVMPPPNITGQLHIGHALDVSFQDSIIRYKRMKGFEALWLPGTDHASIATEVKIVDKLKSEGTDKNTLGREEFLRRAFEWKDKYGGKICEQLEYLGASCDWDRLAFTMDENLSKAVKETFVRYYRKGMITRGARIVNMCPKCKTAISDAEVEYETEDGRLWHIRYPETSGNGSGITVATTRPETMLGDTAVAVNPSDKRYSHLIGKMLSLPLTNRQIPIIADEYVDPSFGTGAVKITPAHDPNDFEVGLRHNLEVIRVKNDDGNMNENAFAYAGMSGDNARAQIIKDLEAGGCLVKIEKHTHNAPHCHRCHGRLEPIISKQWFLKMGELAKPAIASIYNKEIKFIPKRFEKNYLRWMENLRDWCISRQLWWGHRIPVYYCDDCGAEICELQPPAACKCGGKLRQDEDVLDTWFSSALWPFSTLGWPNETADMKKFYPTNVLVTAYDIITFWVSRMIFSAYEFTGKAPFSEVLIHGLVRDEQGRKLSKSLGNGIDPLEIIDEVGADVLRISLIAGISAGGDIKYSPKKQEGYRNFMNKIWNASRFVLMNAENVDILPAGEIKLTIADKWILTKLTGVITKVTKLMDKYEIGLAASCLYDFVWSEFCDWYIELSKTELYTTDALRKQNTVSMLVFVLTQILKLCHPIIPFITSEIYDSLQELKYDGIFQCPGEIMLSDYPEVGKNGTSKILKNYSVAANMTLVMDTIKAIRNLRSEFNVKYSRRTQILVIPKEGRGKVLALAGDYIVKLASGTELKIISGKPDSCAMIVTELGDFYIPLGELVDISKEIERLKGELELAQSELERAKGKLKNTDFVSRAPANVVKAEQLKVEKYSQKIADLNAKILEIQG